MMRNQKSTGHSLVEMICAMVIVIPIFLICIDLYFVIMGYWWTMSSCRMAARAAAQGPPNAVLRDSPKQRALEFLNSSGDVDKSMIHLVGCDVIDSVQSMPDPTYGGAVNGTVSVDITVDVTPPFLLKMVAPGQKFTICASQSCPYTWVMNGKKTEAAPDSLKRCGTVCRRHG